MNSIYYTLATIYRQYVDRKLSSPYFRTVMTVIFLLFLHVVQLVLLFNLPDYFIMPGVSNSDTGSLKYAKGFLYFGILISLFYILINKNRVINIVVNDKDIKKCKRVLIIYFIADLIIMTILFIFRGLRMGTLHW